MATIEGICPNCEKTERGAECSFYVETNNGKTTYTCEACGTVYSNEPKQAK